MKKLLLIALLIWSAGTASATAYTANTTGPWNVAATWSGVGVPGDGDTAIINNSVVVTIPVGYTAIIGTSPADDTTVALGCTDATATGTGKLIIAGTFIFRGHIAQCNGTWTVNAGATVTHDSSLAASPSTRHYSWAIGLNNGTAAKLDASAGTTGSHITFNIAGGSGYGGGTHGTTCASGCGHEGSFYCTFCDVSDWGGNSASFQLAAFNASTATEGFLWDHSTCVRCGQVDSWNNAASSNFVFTNSRFTAPNLVAGTNAFITDSSGSGFNTTLTAGARDFSNSVIVGGFSFFSSSLVRGSSMHTTASATILESTCGASDAAPLLGNRSYAWDTFTNVIIYNCIAATGVPADFPGGTNPTRVIILRTGNTTNAHFINDLVATTTLDGCIAQLEGDQGAGASNADLFQTLQTAAAWTITIKHCLSLPDGGGHALGTFINDSDATVCNGTTTFCPTIVAENNTYGGTDSGTLAIGTAGENGTAFAGMFSSIRNNLVYFGFTGTTANAGVAWATKWHTSTTPVANTFSNADYNGFINSTAGIANRYFRSVSDATEYTIVPGAHDVSVAANPFVAPTRNFQTWCATQDPAATTFALCIADFNAGTISTSSITTMYDWIRAGWAPKGAAGLSLKAAGYDASDLGAVPWVAGSCGSGVALMGVGCN